MLDEERIRDMIRLSLFERGKGREDLRIGKFFRGDYVALELLKAFLCCTVGYGLLLVIVAFANMEYIMDNIVRMDIVRTGALILIGYALLLGIYLSIAYISSHIRYKRVKKSVSRYMAKLSNLERENGKGKA